MSNEQRPAPQERKITSEKEARRIGIALMKEMGTYRGRNTRYIDGLPKDTTPEQLYRLSDYETYDLMCGDEFVRIWKIFGDPVLDEDSEI